MLAPLLILRPTSVLCWIPQSLKVQYLRIMIARFAPLNLNFLRNRLFAVFYGLAIFDMLAVKKQLEAKKTFRFVLKRFRYFFKAPYQIKASLVPHGLVDDANATEDRWLMICRLVVKSGSRNITNPSGHYASEADSNWYVALKKYLNRLRSCLLFRNIIMTVSINPNDGINTDWIRGWAANAGRVLAQRHHAFCTAIILLRN